MTTRPHGEWPSPIGVADAAAASGSFAWPAVAGDRTWWCRTDPTTGDVRLWCREADGSVRPALPAGWSVRNRVIGYGGRPFAVDGNRLVVTSLADGRLYLIAGDAAPVPLTPPDGAGRHTWYADLQLPPGSDRVWCVREQTRDPQGPDDGDPAPRTSRDLVAVPLSGAAADDPAAVVSVAASHHFLTNVRVRPDGRGLLWIGWDHPAMPWEGTELCVAELGADGRAGAPRVVLGGPSVSVPQAEWADDGTVYAMADPDGWWNLHRVDPATDSSASCVLPLAEDCAGAIWRVGATWFVLAGEEVVFVRTHGEQTLTAWHRRTGELRELAAEWTDLGSSVATDGRTVVAVAGSATAPHTVIRVEVASGEVVDCAAGERDPRLAPWFSVPRRRTAYDDLGQEVHFVWYPPTNPAVEGPPGELPPLLVHVHGGPTSRTDAVPDPELSLFTSRGFAVASVDYGGSTGYGRAYRDRLKHSWGITDVSDAVTVARALAAAGEVDGDRMAVRGGSAGGWTSLACLAFADDFRAGAVYYPISDPLRWSGEHTHDFESRYVEYLIGRLPQQRERFERVSPLLHADRIAAPLVMLQGEDDTICPPVQARAIVTAVAERGLWHRLELFAGEGHGFRQASSVERSLRLELELYAHALGCATDPDATDPDATASPTEGAR